MKCFALLLALAACLWGGGDPPLNRLVFGGDVMLGRYVYLQAQSRNDPTWPFREVAAILRDADIAFANLESPFAPNPPYFEDRMVFRAHPSMVEGLKFAGIDIVSTANNHVRDAGPPGIVFTLETLAKNGIAAVGAALRPEDAHKGVVLQSKGVRFGFLAYTYDQRNGNHPDDDPRVAMVNEAAVARDVKDLRGRCDVVIVSMHAGYEYHARPNRRQISFARAAIDAGASIVVGHHPHVVQPVEEFKGGLIFYSLGNLVFDQPPKKGVRQRAIAEVVFSGTRITGHKLY
ncbi:MAG: CapA family protein [Bryobacterales bacterium]|nr:CapA family protein [Bryobacterales bacterium]